MSKLWSSELVCCEVIAFWAQPESKLWLFGIVSFEAMVLGITQRRGHGFLHRSVSKLGLLAIVVKVEAMRSGF